MEQVQRISRLGMFTASSIYKLMNGGKRPMTETELANRAKGDRKTTVETLFGDGAMTYIHEKIAEIITGESAPQAKGASLDWGNNYEKDAAMWLQQTYPFEYMGKENFKFFQYNEFSGGSPDGLSDTRVIELKCPYVSANHVGWLLGSQENGNLWLKDNYPEYYAQVQFNMLCCNREKATIASYDPRTVDHVHRMAVLEVDFDTPYVEDMKVRIDKGVEIIRNTLKSI